MLRVREINMEDCVKILPKQTFTSNLQVCRFTYEWKIKNFSYFTPGTIESPKFSSGSSDLNDQWTLKVTFKEFQELSLDDCSYISICLCSFNKDSQLFTKCKLTTKGYKKTVEHCFKRYLDKITWDLIMLKNHSLTPFCNPLEDSLTLLCELTIASEQNNFLDNESLNYDIARRKLNHDYEQLLEGNMLKIFQE